MNKIYLSYVKIENCEIISIPNRHDESNGKSCLYRQVNCYVHIKTREISLTIVLSFLSANVLQNGTGHLHDICKLEMASKVCTANIK